MGPQVSESAALSDKRARAPGADEEERLRNQSRPESGPTVIQISLSSMAGP